MKNHDVVEYHGTKRRLRRVIVYQLIWLQISTTNNTVVVLFYLQNCKHSLISIDLIALVYELFDSLSYSELITFSVEILVYFLLRIELGCASLMMHLNVWRRWHFLTTACYRSDSEYSVPNRQGVRSLLAHLFYF